MFIGKQEIKEAKGEGALVKITFKDKACEPVEMNKNLYEFIVTEKQGNGMLADVIRHKLAYKYLLDMSEYGLTPISAPGIANGIANLISNLREEAMAKKFGKKEHEFESITISEILAEVEKN